MILRASHNPPLSIKFRNWLLYKNRGVAPAINTILGTCGSIASIVGGIRWHADWALASISFMLFSAYLYTSTQYLKLRYRHDRPKQVLRKIHGIAEELRRLNSYNFGKMSPDEVVKLFETSCREIGLKLLEGYNCLGLPFSRVTFKICIDRDLFTLAVVEKDGEPSNFNTEGEDGDKNPFWTLLRRACRRDHYQTSIKLPEIKKIRGNSSLTGKPKFIALDYLGDTLAPTELNSVIKNCFDERGGLFDHRTSADTLWSALRVRVNSRYENCCAVLVTGNPLLNSSTQQDNELTRKPIGLIGLDSQISGLLDNLSQDDMEFIAGIADQCYIPFKNAETSFKRYVEKLKKEG